VPARSVGSPGCPRGRNNRRREDISGGIRRKLSRVSGSAADKRPRQRDRRRATARGAPSACRRTQRREIVHLSCFRTEREVSRRDRAGGRRVHFSRSRINACVLSMIGKYAIDLFGEILSQAEKSISASENFKRYLNGNRRPILEESQPPSTRHPVRIDLFTHKIACLPPLSALPYILANSVLIFQPHYPLPNPP
jgi:hypothetical protein